MKLTRNLLMLFLCVTSYCNAQDDVAKALNLAGANRAELEKALEHYRGKDERKYQAACFLIASMPYHQSDRMIMLNDEHHRFFANASSLFKEAKVVDVKKVVKENDHIEFRKKLALAFDTLPLPINKGMAADIKTISSDFLIDNIDSAFDVWENNPLLKKMSFDDFKEFILPYRTSSETLGLKRSEIRKMYEKILSKDGYNTIRFAVENYKDFMIKQHWVYEFVHSKASFDMYDLFISSPKPDCHEEISWTCNFLRSCGIPVVYEFTSQWTEREKRHFWCASPDSIGVVMPYTAPYRNLGEDWDSDIKYAGKVFRKQFGVNKKSPYFLHAKDEYIPHILSSPLLSDQTHRYHQTITLRIPFSSETPNNLAYLCFFGRNGNNPVAWGVIDKEKKEVMFEQAPINILFFPAYYENNKLKSFGNPFILYSKGDIDYIPKPMTIQKEKSSWDITLKDNNIHITGKINQAPRNLIYHPVIPNHQKLQQMHLLRKFPPKRHLTKEQEKFVGSYILGKNEIKQKYDTLLVVDKVPGPYIQDLYLNKKGKYRYYSIRAPRGKRIRIAYLELLAEYSKDHICRKPVPLPAFSDDMPLDDNQLYKINGVPIWEKDTPPALFNRNLETFEDLVSFEMDFSTPVQIERVRFAPVNANNMIVIGDRYKLSYYDKEWKELETTMATANYLSFNNVPTETIYWLKNLDNGVEELIFFYQDGKQYFDLKEYLSQ
ncbi:hypothetical protein [Viscerimonas tarda]